MKPNVKKLLILNLPYLFFVWLFMKGGEAYRLTPGTDLSEKLLHIAEGFSLAFSNALPSLNGQNFLIGVARAVIVRLLVYFKGKNAKKYRKGVEYGSARWGNAKDIEPYIDVPGHTPLSSKGKIKYPHYPHIPQQSHTAKPSGTAAQFHSTFRSGNPDNPTSIASHITVSSYTAALSQCHFRSIIQSIPHTLQHQEISTFRSVTHALVVSQQTHAVMFRLLLFYTESCKIPRGFLQLFPISRCLFTPHFI